MGGVFTKAVGLFSASHTAYSSSSEEMAISALRAADPIDRLTNAQLEEFRGAFAAFDRDKGGSIDATELKALMSSVGQVPTDEEVAEMVRIADADGSGSVDFAEFVTLMAHKMAEAESEDRVRMAFAVFDDSGDGYVDAEELRNLMMNVGEPATMEDIRQVLSEVDTNGDGRIDYTEFAKVFISREPKGSSSGGLSDTNHLSSKSLTHAGAPACSSLLSDDIGKAPRS